MFLMIPSNHGDEPKNDSNVVKMNYDENMVVTFIVVYCRNAIILLLRINT